MIDFILGASTFILLTAFCGAKWCRYLCPWAKSVEEKIPFGFLFGLYWFALFSTLAYSCSLTFIAFICLYVVSTCLFIFFFRIPDEPVSRNSPISKRDRIILILLCAAGIYLLYHLGGFMGGDGEFHQAKIQHLLAGGKFTNSDPFLPGLSDSRYLFSVSHSFSAIVLSFLPESNGGVSWFWFYLPAFLIPIVIYSQYVLGVTLLNRSIGGVLVAAIWIIHYLVLAYTDTRYWSDAQTLNYPSGLCAHILIPVILSYYCRVSENPSINLYKGAILTGLLIWLTSLVHLFYGLLLLGTLLLFCAAIGFNLWDRKQWIKRWVQPLLIAGALPSFWFLYRQWTFPTVKNDFFLAPFGWKIKFKFLSADSFILDPKLTFFSLGHYQEDRLVLLAIVISIISIAGVRRSKWAAYISLSTLTVLAMVSIPFFVSGLASLITAYKIPRMTLLFPVPLAIAGALVFGRDFFQSRQSLAIKSVMVIGSLLIATWLYQDGIPRGRSMVQQLRINHSPAPMHPAIQTIKRIQATGKSRPTIMGVPGIAYHIGAKIPAWILHIPAAHASIEYNFRRFDNIYRFINGTDCGIIDIQHIASDYDVDYLILGKKAPIVSKLQEANVIEFNQYNIYRLPLPEQVFTENHVAVPVPWTDRHNWMPIRCPKEDSDSTWWPDDPIYEMNIPSDPGETFMGRNIKTDGLDRSLIYKPLLPVNQDNPPKYVSFHLYLERAQGASIIRLSAGWPGASYTWSKEEINTINSKHHFRDGWNSVLLERPSSTASDTPWPKYGLTLHLVYEKTNPPHNYIIGIRGITAYTKRY